MEEIETDRRKNRNLRRRVSDKVEDQLFDRLTKLEENHMTMGKTLTKVEIIVENSVSLIERFENTLDRMANTLGELNITITKINQKVDDNSKDIVEVEGNLIKVGDKLKTLDDKGKIDFLQLVKDNFAKYIFGGGIIGAILLYLDHLLDTWISLKK
jgi:uncharacterized coiled-coil protein SlyX